MLQYRFTQGTVSSYSLQIRVTVQIERGADEGAVSQVAELAGRLVLTVESVDEQGADIAVATEQLHGDIPEDGFFGEAAVGDPLSAIPDRIRVGPRGENDQPKDAQRDPTEGTLDTLFPPLPEVPVADGDGWTRSTSDDAEGDPTVIHGRFIGREPGDDGVVRPIVGTFSGHQWSAGDGIEGVSVHGEVRRMAEVSLRTEDGWAHRADARVESILRIGGGDNAPTRSIITTVEMLLTAEA